MLNTFYNYLIKPYKNKNILTGKLWHYFVILFLVIILNVGMVLVNLYTSQTRETFKVQYGEVIQKIPTEYVNHVEKCWETDDKECKNYSVKNENNVNFTYLVSEANPPQINKNEPGMIIYQDKLFLSTGDTYNGIYQIDKTKTKTITDLIENGSVYNIALPIVLQQTIVVVTSIIVLTILLVIIALSLLKLTHRFKQLKITDIFKIAIYSTNIGLIASLIVFAFNRSFLVAITIFIAIYGINAFLNVLFTFIRNTPEQRKRIDEEKYL